MKPRQFSRKTLAALSLGLCASAVNAQNSITIYGIADASLRYTHGLSAANAAANGSVLSLSSGVNTTSRWGLRGSEDLGGGMRAIFNFESGLNIDSGIQANAAKYFDRASIVGLQSAWGAVTLGRQTSMLSDAASPVDPLGFRFANMNPNVSTAALSAHGLGIEFGPAGATNGSYRIDNSIKYSGKFRDFTVQAMYGFGEQAGRTSSLSSSGLGLGYRTDAFTATLGYQQFNSATGLTLNGYLGGVSGKLAGNTLSLTYGSWEAETSLTTRTTNSTFGIGGTVPLTDSLSLVLGYYDVNRSRTAKKDDGYKRLIAFLEYQLSKRTRLYAEFDRTTWENGYQAATFPSSGTGASVGVMHRF